MCQKLTGQQSGGWFTANFVSGTRSDFVHASLGAVREGAGRDVSSRPPHTSSFGACSSRKRLGSTPDAAGTKIVRQALNEEGVVSLFARKRDGTSVLNLMAQESRLSPGLCGKGASVSCTVGMLVRQGLSACAEAVSLTTVYVTQSLAAGIVRPSLCTF